MGNDAEHQAPGAAEPTRTSRILPTLDGALAAALERVTRVAAASLAVPAAAVVLLGDDRRTFAGGSGVPVWLARDPGALLRSGLSARLMDTPGPMALRDARADSTESVAASARELGVAGFLGMHLRSSDGEAAALICAIDPEPRDWGADEVRLFGEVAASALTELELQGRLAEAARAERQLRHDALHDRLTGLPNRTFLVERLRLALDRARRDRGGSFALLFLDLDNFKAVNESFGHHAGDDLLVEVARRLSGCLRSADMMARLGGDEFALLLESVRDPSDAARVAARLEEALRAPVHLGDLEVFTSGSIGIALPAGPEETAQRLLRSADTAMFRAKERGRARFEVYDVAMHAAAIQRLRLESELRRALEREQLTVHYQPIVSVETGRIVAAEALLRWEHPERGTISPAQFIPVAEQIGTIVEIGRWVLREACAQLARWRTAHADDAPETVCVNVSVKQLAHAALVEHVQGALRSSGLEPGRLELEITESAMIDNVDAAVETIDALKRVGPRVLIDDFGTGYSSLSYLARLGPQGIKVDRAFVQQIGTDAGSLALVRGIVALIHGLELHAIAEGVETSEQLEALRELGCDLAQGFLISRPVPPESFERLLREQPAARDA